MTAKPVTAHPRIKAGAVALGVGGNLIAGCKTGDFQSITDLARRFIEAIREARGL